MNYTQSPNFSVDAGTGHRFHDATLPIPTVWSSDDANQLIWSLMEVVLASGSAPKSFNRADPSSYGVLLTALKQLFQSRPGQVAFFGMTAAPSGWLKANGAAVSRTAYSELFAAIGTTFGIGDGATTFNLPDLRGRFPRGLDDGRGVDPGRSLGSDQGDAIRNIWGEFAAVQTGTWTSGAFTTAAGGQNGSDTGGEWRNFIRFDASRQVPTAAENRPTNVALLACIKY